MDAGVRDLLGPGTEGVVQLGEAFDASRLGLGEEALADVAIQALLLSPPGRLIGLGVDEVDPEHRAGACQLDGGIGRAVVDVEMLGNAAAREGGAQHVLAGAGVLFFHPPAADEQAAVVVDEHEELGAL